MLSAGIHHSLFLFIYFFIQYCLDPSVFVSVNVLLCLFVCCEGEADELFLKELSTIAPVAILLHNHLQPMHKDAVKTRSLFQASGLMLFCLSILTFLNLVCQHEQHEAYSVTMQTA